MKVSLNIIKQYIDFELPPVDELVQKVNQQLGGVEDIIDLGAKYNDALIVVVAKCEKHPDADRLSVCMIDDGGVTQGVERDEFGLIQVVCGAPNVRGGMMAIWLPPKSTVPASFDEATPFVLESRELRGVVSNGMLAAADELAIGTDHEGIVEITEYDLPANVPMSDKLIGKKFADIFGLDDTIIEIENKMFTHRPDCFGQLGVAREIAGIQRQQFKSPEWYTLKPSFPPKKGLELSVENEAGDGVPRFMALGVKGVKIGPSPLWLQCALVAMGSKPINNVVDITNYMMLLTSQPLHAYDYDKLRGHKLGARRATEGEKIHLLNDKNYELTSEDIVIVDGEGPVGLGGIMGGGDSEVSETTMNVVLEAASFDMYAVRKTSMRHGLFTDAVTRFNKGQSSLQQPYVIAQAMSLLTEIAGGELATEVFDEGAHVGKDVSSTDVSTDFINERLGLQLSGDEIRVLLANVEFNVDTTNDTFAITPPFWRTDIELPEDIVEEVGRLYGFDKLTRELPARSIKPASQNAAMALKQRVRDSLSRAGANEVLTYSFVHEKVITNADQDSSAAFRLSNALSPNLHFYRLTVLPSLLDKVTMNIKLGHDEFILFEIGKGHEKSKVDQDGLPLEPEMLDAVYASKKPGQGAAYYHVRRLAQQLCLDLGFTLRYKPIENEQYDSRTAPFDSRRSALLETYDGVVIGIVGELKQNVIRAFKLPSYTAAMSIDLERLQRAFETPRERYAPLSKYPSVTQDISLKVAADVSYESVFRSVYDSIQKASDAIDVQILPVVIYQPEGDASTKTITLRVRVTSHDRTLREDEVSELLDAAAKSANELVSAVRV